MKKLIILIFIILFSQIVNAETMQSYKINNILKSQGKFFRFIGDEKYTVLSLDDMNSLINKVISKKGKYIDSLLLDCDDLSLILHAEIVKLRYENKDKYKIAIGEAVIKDIGENHSLMFFITKDKLVYIFNPYTMQIYSADKVKLLFIRM